MKKLSLATMIAALAAMQIGFAMIDAAGNLTAVAAANAGAWRGLMEGNSFSLFSLSRVWTYLPSFPDLDTLFRFDSLFMIALMLSGIFYFVRLKLGKPLLWVAWSSAALWIVPHLMSVVALNGNSDPRRVGGWLALTLVSIFYSMLGCFVFAGMQWSELHLMSKPRAKNPMGEPAVSAAGSHIIEFPS